MLLVLHHFEELEGYIRQEGIQQKVEQTEMFWWYHDIERWLMLMVWTVPMERFPCYNRDICSLSCVGVLHYWDGIILGLYFYTKTGVTKGGGFEFQTYFSSIPTMDIRGKQFAVSTTQPPTLFYHDFPQDIVSLTFQVVGVGWGLLVYMKFSFSANLT